MESPTPPVASLEAPRPDSPPPVQEEETSLPSEEGLYDKEVSSEETPPAETDETLSTVEHIKEEVPETTPPPPVAKRTRVRSGLTPEPEVPGQAKKTRRKAAAKRNVGGSEPKVNNPRAGGAKRKAAKAASAAVTAAAIQDTDNDPDEKRNSSEGLLNVEHNFGPKVLPFGFWPYQGTLTGIAVQ